MASSPLIEKEFLERLERLALTWQKSFSGLVGGHNASRFSGSGQEFLDHRHFHLGDDLRAVNWRAYLRLDKLFMKMFQVEPRVPVRLLLDVSASMETGEPSKFAYAQRLTAALCYIGLVRLDSIHIQPFREVLLPNLRSGGGRQRFLPVVEFLTQQQAGGRTDYLRVAKQFVDAYPQRGLVIVISDFLDEQDVERPLQLLHEFGHELLLVHLWADEDRTPPWDGELDLEDAETGEHLKLDFNEEARTAYTAAFDEHARGLRERAIRSGGRYIGLPTSVSLDEAIFTELVRSQGVA